MMDKVPSLEEIREACKGKHTTLFLPALHLTPFGKYIASSCIPEENMRGIPSVYNVERKEILDETILLDRPERIEIAENTFIVRGKKLPRSASTSFSLTMNLYARPGDVAAIPLSFDEQRMTVYLVKDKFVKFQYHERKLPRGYIHPRYSKLTSPNLFALTLDAVNAAILGIGKKEPVRREYFTVSCCGAEYGYVVRLELLSTKRKVGRVKLRVTSATNWFGVKVEGEDILSMEISLDEDSVEEALRKVPTYIFPHPAPGSLSYYLLYITGAGTVRLKKLDKSLHRTVGRPSA